MYFVLLAQSKGKLSALSRAFLWPILELIECLCRSDNGLSVPLFSFGWTLFLVSKGEFFFFFFFLQPFIGLCNSNPMSSTLLIGKLLASPPDLLNAFHLLLCCLNFLVENAPLELQTSVSASEDTLSFLCEKSGASYEEVNHINITLFSPLLKKVGFNAIPTNLFNITQG